MRFTGFKKDVSLSLLAVFALAVLELLVNASLASRTNLHPQLDAVCDASQAGSHSRPLPFSPEGIKLDWLSMRGGVACGYSCIFKAVLHPHEGYLDSSPARMQILYFLSYLPALITIAALELAFLDRSTWTLLLGAMYQLVTAGVTFPFFFAFLPRELQLRRVPSRRDVHALAVALAVGYSVTSVGMGWSSDQSWIIIWAFFPFLMYAVQAAWCTCLPDHSPRPAQAALQVLFSAVAAVQLAAHLPLVYQRLVHPSTIDLADIFLPSSSPFAPSPLSLEQAAHRFLQYDFAFAHLAALVFLVRRRGGGAKDRTAFGAILTAVSVALGPGAAVVGGWWWTSAPMFSRA